MPKRRLVINIWYWTLTSHRIGCVFWKGSILTIMIAITLFKGRYFYVPSRTWSVRIDHDKTASASHMRTDTMDDIEKYDIVSIVNVIWPIQQWRRTLHFYKKGWLATSCRRKNLYELYRGDFANQPAEKQAELATVVRPFLLVSKFRHFIGTVSSLPR